MKKKKVERERRKKMEVGKREKEEEKKKEKKKRKGKRWERGTRFLRVRATPSMRKTSSALFNCALVSSDRGGSEEGVPSSFDFEEMSVFIALLTWPIWR